MIGTKIRHKAKDWATQEKKVFASLYRQPQTRLEASRATNVPIQNLCRYIHNFKKSQTVFLVKVDRCPISGMKAEFLSTNPKHRPEGQLKMFEA